MDTKGLQKEFINWCKSKNKQPKSEDETKQLFIAFMKEKHPEEYKQAMENQQKQQATKALHGAKLNYFKSLKHQCAEDEEIVYYKKGGSVTCGCKKKEQGGEVKKDCGGSAIAKFKKMKSGKKITIKQKPLVNPSDTVHVNGIAYSVTNSDGSPVDKRFKPYSGKVEEEDRKKAKKGDKDAQKRQLKQDLASSEKCGGKVKKHQEGSVIAKFKALRKGGSLNGIPFMQAGTPNGGISLYFPKRPISGAEAYMNNTAINDPKYKIYTNKANAYANEAPTIYNTFNNILNRLKASYYGNKAAIKEYDNKVNEYFKDQWNRGNYGKAIFGSPFVPIVRDYPPNRPLITYINK